MRRSLVAGFAVMVCALSIARAQTTGEVTGIAGSTLSPASLGGVSLGAGPGGFRMAAVKNQPYSLVEKTTTVQTLTDGTTITRVNEVRRMRDAEGREREEYGQSKDGKFEPTLVFLTDPIGRTRTTLSAYGKTANVQHFAEPKPQTPEQAAKAVKAAEIRAKAEAYRKEHPAVEKPGNEDLPGQSIAGVYADGKRSTLVIPAGFVGNDRDIRVVMETWTSPELKITLMRTSDDPRIGKSRMEVSELSRADPSPALFQIPADYKVTELKRNGLE